MIKTLIIMLCLLCGSLLQAQPVPAVDENIDFLVTFGRNGGAKWGDDDFCQIFFFVIPQSQTSPVFIRIFDPDVGGKNDEGKGHFNTTTKFSVYGGKGAFSDKDIENKDPIGNYKGGNLLASKTFAASSSYDGKWYVFGPFNPSEGDLQPKMGGYLFKIIAQGISGDDGNLYRYFLSTEKNENKPVEGGNAFTYEYTFRLHQEAKSVAHIYPFIDQSTISVKQYNFDFDNDAYIRIVSVSKPGIKTATSGDNEWAMSKHPITEKEKGTSLDIQMIKFGAQGNNNVAFYIVNQHDKLMPFFSIPIGGVPHYGHRIHATPR